MRGNCPNCNGVLSYAGGLHCDYCGAWFERPRAVIRDWSGNDAFYADDGIYRVYSESVERIGCTG